MTPSLLASYIIAVGFALAVTLFLLLLVINWFFGKE